MAVVAAYLAYDPTQTDPYADVDVVGLVVAGPQFLPLIASIAAALFVGADFRFPGAWDLTCLHLPNSRWAATAKVAVVVAFSLVVGLFEGLLAVIVVVAVYNTQRPDVGLGMIVVIVLAQAVKTVAWAVLAALMTLVLRSAVVSSIATLVLAWAVEPAVRTAVVVSGADGWLVGVQNVLPFTAANALTASADSVVFASSPLGPWWSAAVVLVWVSLLAVAADVALRRRGRAPNGAAGGRLEEVPLGKF